MPRNCLLTPASAMAAYRSSVCRSQEPGVGSLLGLLQHFNKAEERAVRSAFNQGGPLWNSDVSHLNQAFAVRNQSTEVADVMELATVTGEMMATPGRTVFCRLPLFHVNGQLATGLLPNFWALVEHYKVDWYSGVPTVNAALLQVPRVGRDISSLRCGVCGAAPMHRELIADFQREAGVNIVEG